MAGTTTAPPTGGERAAPLDKGLKVGAIGLLSAVVIGVASTAPGYSLAASLGVVTTSSSFQTPAVFLVAFVPMLFIAAAYYYLNRADPDCGTTFTWVTRAIGPKSGWMNARIIRSGSRCEIGLPPESNSPTYCRECASSGRRR